MQIGMTSLSAPNSLARCVLRALHTSLPWNALRYALAENLERCLHAQAEAIARFAPDVVIGSSWGGGVAQLALARGVWTSPTLLLCPALGRAMVAAAWPFRGESSGGFEQVCAHVRALDEATRARVLLVHGDADDVLPIELSRAFALRGGVRLVEVGGGGHRLDRELLGPSGAAVLLSPLQPGRGCEEACEPAMRGALAARAEHADGDRRPGPSASTKLPRLRRRDGEAGEPDPGPAAAACDCGAGVEVASAVGAGCFAPEGMASGKGSSPLLLRLIAHVTSTDNPTESESYYLG
jgi:hypothetical protein